MKANAFIKREEIGFFTKYMFTMLESRGDKLEMVEVTGNAVIFNKYPANIRVSENLFL